MALIAEGSERTQRECSLPNRKPDRNPADRAFKQGLACSNREIPKSPVGKPCNRVAMQHYFEANCWSLSTAESISPRSPHWRVSDLFSALSIEAVWPGARLTRTRAAVVMPVSGSVLS